MYELNEVTIRRALGQATLDAQPFSALLGARLTDLQPGSAEVQIPIRRELTQQHGHVHSGVLGYAAELCLAFAASCAMDIKATTVAYQVKLLRPAIGTRLVARGRAIAAGRSQADCRCEVFVVAGSGIESICATAEGSITCIGMDGLRYAPTAQHKRDG